MNRLLHTDNINSISTQFNRKCTYYLFNIPTSTENGVSKYNFSNQAMRRKKLSIPKKLSPHRLRGTRFSLFPLRLLFPPYPKDLGCPHISLPPRWGGNALEMGSSPFGVGCNVCSRKNARGQAEIGVSSWNGRKRFHRGSLLRAVMVTGCRSFCNRCVQLRRLALPRTANRYSAPETGSTLRRRRGRD